MSDRSELPNGTMTMNPEIDTNFVEVERAVYETEITRSTDGYYHVRYESQGRRILRERDNKQVGFVNDDATRFWLNVDFYPNARAI